MRSTNSFTSPKATPSWPLQQLLKSGKLWEVCIGLHVSVHVLSQAVAIDIPSGCAHTLAAPSSPRPVTTTALVYSNNTLPLSDVRVGIKLTGTFLTDHFFFSRRSHVGIARAGDAALCHGGGFCKDVWTPIISRLQQTSLLQRKAPPPQFIAFDFPYHGEHRDVSERATLHLEDPTSPRVAHPAMKWAKWAPADVQRQVRLLRETQESNRRPVIGIGHSMGAAALWKTEVANTGTFDGLILFEPMVNAEEYPKQTKSVDFLISITLKRPAKWESFEAADREIKGLRNFARWHPESLQHYIKGAVVKVSPENNMLDPDAEYALSCHPHIEASVYSGGTIQMTEDEMLRVQCPITFQYGARTRLFLPEYHQWLIDKHPRSYTIADAVPETTHALVMEDPDTCVSRIVEALEKLPTFAAPGTNSKF